MKIISVNIPKEEILTGLETVKMDKLGQVVLITGKNGAGKSRLLKLISDNIAQHITKSTRDEFEKTVNKNKKEILNLQNEKTTFEKGKISDQKYNEWILHIETEIENLKEINDNYEKSVFSNQRFVTDSYSNNYEVLNFAPEPYLERYSNLSIEDLRQASFKLGGSNIDDFYKGTLANIKTIQDEWFEATHPLFSGSEIKKKTTIERYDKLNNLIYRFFKVKLDRNSNGDPILFEKMSIEHTSLSKGQIIILQLCLALFHKTEKFNEVFILFDEPENHLHPSIIIEIIDEIIKNIPDGQIWIATHSIPVLSHFDPSCIWYIEDNKVTHFGKCAENVLIGLLGDDESRIKLQDFTSLPEIHSLNRHSYECLFEPQAVLTGKNDPQTKQIRSVIEKYLEQHSPVRILDYGAGKGRLLASIIENETFLTQIDYFAFDEYDTDKIHCESLISKAYKTDHKTRYYNKLHEILGVCDKKSFDIVVMCNVLHEIEPSKWIDVFKFISDLLSDNGQLLVVEDQEIPVGELAHKYGYIVLDKAELKTLFEIPETEDRFVTIPMKENNRLKAHLIPQQYLCNISQISKQNALERLQDKAKSEIQDIRIKKEKDYRTGKKLGFWLQQFANASIAING